MTPEPTKTQPPNQPPSQVPTIPRWLIGVLLAVALMGGIATGAVLGPASAGPLTSDSPILQRALALLAARELSASPMSTQAPVPPAKSNAVTESPPAHNEESAHAGTSHAPASSSSSSSEAGASTPSASEGPAPAGTSEPEKAAHKPFRLPAIEHVWLIVLGGSTLADATTTPTAYPYLTGQLVKQGTLLTGYSALDAYELAGDAALLPGGIEAALTLLSEPGCDAPPGPAGVPTGTGVPAAPGAPCTMDAPPAPAEADAFLKRVAGPILSSPAYRENGLIVITFGLASNGAEGPATTVALQASAGALLLSPLLHGARHSPTPFDALAPRQSLEAIFKH